MIPERLVPGTLEWDVFIAEHQQRYEHFAHICRGLSVLDAACGVGYGSRILSRAGARSVLGVDISPDAVKYAAEHFGDDKTSFAVADVLNLESLGRSFDAVVSFETIEHVQDPAAFLASAHRVLRPGGLFVCSTPNKEFSSPIPAEPNPYHLSEMTFEQFSAAFSRHFTIEGTYYQSHSPHYRRHLELLRELGRMEKPLRFSKMLALENRVRRMLGKATWSTKPLSPRLGAALPGDFVIERLDVPQSWQLTFVLVGRAK